jgi:hypothetical protein
MEMTCAAHGASSSKSESEADWLDGREMPYSRLSNVLGLNPQ